MDELKFKNGYYLVGNEVFEKKVLAIQRSNQTKKNIQWIWNDRKMSSFNWTIEPDISLDSLYKSRAQQIRDHYDYVLIFCSGGADSTNTLMSFLRNSIHVDEVVAGAPLSGLSNWNWSNEDYSAQNTISETKFTQLPLMEYVQQNFPKTKVTIHDYFYDILDYKEDQWLINSGDYIHPTFAARYNLQRDEYSYLRKLADSGKKIALVYGIDKPMLGRSEEDLYIVFNDQMICNGFKSIDDPNIFVELFYWSADFIPLLIKQGHVVAKWVCRPENNNFFKHALITQKTDPADFDWGRNVYERRIIPLIYPDLNFDNKFQCQKPISAFMGDHDAWFPILHSDLQIRDMMISDYRNLINSIGNNLFNRNRFEQIIGFKLFYKPYKLGKITSFKEL